jgi:hypothetical protein
MNEEIHNKISGCTLVFVRIYNSWSLQSSLRFSVKEKRKLLIAQNTDSPPPLSISQQLVLELGPSEKA